MTSVAEPEAETRIRTIVFMPSGRGDCAASARMSFEDYLRLEVDGITEWVDGEARVYMPVSRRHQVIVDFLNRLIGLYIELRGGGVLHSAPYVLRPTERGPGREPDLMFVRPEHRDRLLASHAAGPVDLAVEVVSPDGVERDYVEKFREYESAGIPEYWIIDSRPGQERADFFVLRDGRYVSAPVEDGIYRSSVIEGFWLRIEWLWDPEPRVAEALADILGRPLV
jgi:Uma2 family endonuclease